MTPCSRKRRWRSRTTRRHQPPGGREAALSPADRLDQGAWRPPGPGPGGRLAAAGAGVIRLVARNKARGLGDAGEVHLKDLIRRVHLKLVEHQLRDAVTLLAAGGIALAEHVAKAIICGADGIMVDIPLLLALECRLCRNCQQRASPAPLRWTTSPSSGGPSAW